MAFNADKICALCLQQKPASEFHKNCKTSDGLRSSCKICTRATNKKSVLRHRQKRLAEKREYYYRQKDKADFIEKRKARTAKTKKEKAEYDRKRHLANAEKIKSRVKEWTKANPDRRRAITFNYDSRRRAWIRSGVSAKEILLWVNAQPKICKWCNIDCGGDYHIDHVHPLSKGGEHELHNLAVSCPACNLRKNAKLPEQFLAERAITAVTYHAKYGEAGTVTVTPEMLAL